MEMNIIYEQLRAEKHRADEAERRLQETIARLKALNESRVRVVLYKPAFITKPCVSLVGCSSKCENGDRIIDVSAGGRTFLIATLTRL